MTHHWFAWNRRQKKPVLSKRTTAVKTKLCAASRALALAVNNKETKCLSKWPGSTFGINSRRKSLALHCLCRRGYTGMPSGVNDIRIETSNVKGWCVFSRFFLTFIILHFFHSNARVQRPNFGLRTYFVLKLSVDRVTSDIKFKRTSMDAINFRLAKMFCRYFGWPIYVVQTSHWKM